jgi:NAD+ diphosphatase
MTDHIPFSGNVLDRASNRRTDEAWLAAQAAAGLFLPFWQNKPLVTKDRAGFLPWREEWRGQTCVFLGLENGTTNGTQPLFAVDLAGDSEPLLSEGAFAEMRASAFVLPARDTAIAGQAKALLDWHKRHGFCPNCGTPTGFRDGGYRRLCPQCGAEHFPRTDPVVIMLPVFGNECLVGRGPRFPPQLYSAFAGFVEPGESMEEAVRRELREEVDLAVGAVTYHASQPWPFPSSLMLGCYAEAQSHDFQIDGHEIEAARWLTKDEVRARLANSIKDEMKLPATIAIAHYLIRDWARR